MQLTVVTVSKKQGLAMNETSAQPRPDTANGSPKKSPAKLVFWMFIILVVLRVFLWAGLNTAGFCWAEKRWLSDEDKIMRVLQIVDRAGRVILDPKQPGLKDPTVTKYESYDLDKNYRSLEDMRSKNPNCCTIGKYGNFTNFTGDDPNERMSVDLILSYTNKHKEKKSFHYYDTVTYSNCGKVHSLSSSLKI